MPRRIKQIDLEDAKKDGMDETAYYATLSDMMMLLLTFFVMLFSLSSDSEENYAGMLRKIGDALGGKSLVEKLSAHQEISNDIEKFVNDNNLVRQIQVTSDTRGVVMYAEGDLFFNTGTAKLKKEIKRFLTRIAGVIHKSNYKVLVEGHSDDTKIKSKMFPSNWELSSARASAVIRFFIHDGKLEPSRFTAIGYAEHKPRFPMIPENRAKNRRVEIVILRERY